MGSVLTVGQNLAQCRDDDTKLYDEYGNIQKELVGYIDRYTPKSSSVLLTMIDMTSLAENSGVEDKQKTLDCIKEIRECDGVQVLIPRSSVEEYLSTFFSRYTSPHLICKYGGAAINLAFMCDKKDKKPLQVPQYRLHETVMAYQFFVPMDEYFESELSGKRFICVKEQGKPLYVNEATISLIKEYKDFFYPMQVTAQQLEEQKAEREYALMEEAEQYQARKESNE